MSTRLFSFHFRHELIEENTISNTIEEHESVITTEDNIQRYLKKSKVLNTDACTQKWVRILQDYRKKKNISYVIQTLTDKEQLEHELYASEKFYLQLTRNSREIQDGNWFLKTGLGKHTLANMMNDIAQASKINITENRITNHSGRRTAIQLLYNLNINEHTMMEFSGHRSVSELRSYKVPSNEQRLKNTTTLINAIQEPQVLVSTQKELQIPAQFMIQEESQVSIQKEFHISTQEESQVLIQEESQVLIQEESQVHESQYKSQVPIQRKPQILMQFKNNKIKKNRQD
ncbi:700_t:CDS:2 [Gigaspora rosea]|nr:700_t:CDS:2 [Gigaspora rosea]